MTVRRGGRPTNTGKTLGSVSNVRRAQINDAASNKSREEEDRVITASVAHSPTFKNNSMSKIGSITSSNTTPSSSHSSGMMGPDIYSPLFQLANLNLPRDRVTMNTWNRIFYDTHPIVRNAINLHSSFPISKINITCPSKKIQQFFEDMCERIDLYSVVYGAALEFWKIGEAFPYAELDPNAGVWSRITILNPDYVHVKKSVIGNKSMIFLRPDSSLQRLVNSTAPADVKLRSVIPDNIIERVRRGQNIPLDSLHISHLKLLSSPYDIRGTSVIVSVYKDLMLYDKLRESKFAQADSMINPLTLVKLGGNDYRPSQADIEAFKGILEDAQYDKDFKLVTHADVSIERNGAGGSVMDISSDVSHITENLYAGLMVPKSLMDQEGASYASSSVGLEVLRQRYDIFRNMMKKWLERKIFAPISEIQDFFEYKDGKKVLVVPQVDFNHMNLYDLTDYIQSISSFVGNKQVSLQTLYRSLDLSYEEEKRRLREEAIDEAKAIKEKEILSNLRLSELEKLDPSKPISEPARTSGSSANDDGEGGGGLPGLNMGIGEGSESESPGGGILG